MKKTSRSRKPIRLRYVPEAAYRRGGETRGRLIDTATRLFSEHGFEATSTRDIAGAASLNTPALQYYFNNKEGLYAACAERVAAHGWAVVKEEVETAERLLEERARDRPLMEAFCRVQGRFADSLDGAGGEWLLWMARERAAPRPTISTLLDHRRSRRLLRVSRAIMARLADRTPRDPECRLHEMALSGELLRFYLMRRDALRALGWSKFDAAGLALVKRVVRAHCMAALRAMVAQRARRAGGVRPRNRS
jgi:AcrR family transcriptional regulator